MVTSSTALHLPASLWSLTCTPSNHSHLISIGESSSPVAINQALYKTALIPNTHCLFSRLHALHLSIHQHAGSLWMSSFGLTLLEGDDKDLSNLLEVAFSWFNKKLILLILVCLSIQCVTWRPDHKEKLHNNYRHPLFRPADFSSQGFQDGHPIEDYVEEFSQVSYRVPWKESTLKTIFWGGLDGHIYQQMPASDIACFSGCYIEYALWLSGSSFTVWRGCWLPS